MAIPPEDEPGVPRWVVALGLGALAAGLVVVALHLMGYGPGGHGP